MTRVLLTGASGFVGRQILAGLRESDCSVRVVSRSDHSFPSDVEVCPTKDLFSEDETWWAEKLDGVDRVIHAAWYVEPGKYLTSEKNARCLHGSLSLFNAFLRSQASHFTGVGTCSEYAFEEQPIPTDGKLSPETPYAAAKAALGLATTGLASAYGKEAAWCRLFYLYGEGEHPNRLFPALHSALASGTKLDMTSGEQIRDYMDVADAGRQIAQASITSYSGMANICSGRSRTIRELALEIAATYGRPELLNFGARPDNLFDPPCVLGVPSFTS